MPDDEGAALYRAALRAGQAEVPGATPATFVEIGAWCGKSTVYLGAAAEATGAVVLSIDHHRGSEENQPGWDYHEPDLVDPDAGRIDTLAHWRRTMSEAALEASVVGIVGDSPTVAARWDRPSGVLLHRRWVTARSRRGRTFGAGRRTSPSVAGWPSTTSFRTRPTAGARPTSSTARHWIQGSSWTTAPAAACGCCGGRAPSGTTDRISPLG